jgi:release factor glutamine methyltransferase
MSEPRFAPRPGTGSRPGWPHPADTAAELRAAGCVFAEEEAGLLTEAAATPRELAAMVARRAGGLPLEHVVGWAGFAGLRIEVGPGVFVPRRRTEFLLARAAALLRPGAVVLDLCCGSGAVGAALAAAAPGVELHAADLDPAAVRYARRNLAAARGQVHQGDLFAPLPPTLRGRVDILTANVPYVPTGDIPLLPAEARDHEAPLALDGGADGLDLLRRVARDAATWLAPGGTLLSEASRAQVPAALRALRAGGLTAATAHDPDLEATVLLATRPHPGPAPHRSPRERP